MRFVPRPCAEFPNDNPELHDGAAWVCTWSRARPRAVVSAQSLARQNKAAPLSALPVLPGDAAGADATFEFDVTPEPTCVVEKAIAGDVVEQEPAELTPIPPTANSNVRREATFVSEDTTFMSEAPRGFARAIEIEVVAPSWSLEPSEPAVEDNDMKHSLAVSTKDRRVSSKQLFLPTLDSKGDVQRQLSMFGEWTSPPTAARGTMLFAETSNEAHDDRSGLESSGTQAEGDVLAPSPHALRSATPSETAGGVLDATLGAVRGQPEPDGLDAEREEHGVFAALDHLDDVFAADDFSVSPPAVVSEEEGAAPPSVGSESGSTEGAPLPRHDGAGEPALLSALDALFEAAPEEWQTPKSRVELCEDVAVVEQRIQPPPLSASGGFKVPRPEGTRDDDERSTLSDFDLEPLSLDLTPPPPGVSGWDELVRFLSNFLAEHGATRAAALAPGLLEGRRVPLDRLPAAVTEELCGAEIAEQSDGGCWPTPEFRHEASAFHLDYIGGRAPAQELLMWLAPVMRALLASSTSPSAMRAHLEQAGIAKLLNRAA